MWEIYNGDQTSEREQQIQPISPDKQLQLSPLPLA